MYSLMYCYHYPCKINTIIISIKSMNTIHINQYSIIIIQFVLILDSLV